MIFKGKAPVKRFLFGVLALTSAFVFLIESKQKAGNPPMDTGHRRLVSIRSNTIPDTQAVDSITEDGKNGVTWDPSGASWQLWKDSVTNTCSQYKTRFALGLPRTYLVSFPGSGNTWIRYLLEAASGVFTGSVYTDREIEAAGYLGEADKPDSGRTLVQKTHGTALVLLKSNMKTRYEVIKADVPAVLIIRNPARAIISYWKFIKTQGKNKHTKQVPEKSFKTKEFRNYVATMTVLWEQLITDRLLWNTAPVHIVFYEHLVNDPVSYVKGILEFLRFPTEEGRLKCMADHLQGSFKRPKKNETDPYVTGEKEGMSYAVKRVNRLLTLLGYPELPVYEDLL
ncbi:WSC domain-containing protein 1-like [Penaeus japonicus]|uniref:WSC domain-containing protein 1-like n=1 Tax=Penaeus japonicus TaxID=27405 RepID=UPI001C70CEE0|nr:WSC domain-containing protein 1-like [Penaeus japonicus]XP_042880021.1 WSC domain-containing protein 1-like [Penaeus japonicus]